MPTQAAPPGQLTALAHIVQRQHLAVRRVLQAHEPGDGEVGIVGFDGGLHLVQGQFAATVEGYWAGLYAAEHGGAAALVLVGVRTEADDVLVTSLAVAQQGDQVGLGARWSEHRSLLAGELRREAFELVDRGVLAVNVIAQFRLVHVLEHFGRGAGECVAA